MNCVTIDYMSNIINIYTKFFHFYNIQIQIPPVPVAARPKAWVYGRTPARILGSNSAGGHGYLSVSSVVCCQVEDSATG